jgi:NAD(P)-dependent dehydrogenase (short-subunit alcohol dehydrogenase family)
MEKDFEGKLALVTGGTQGMGAAIADRFKLGGARVIKVARSIPDELENDELFEQADMSNADDIDRLIKKVITDYGVPDIIVNNVGGSSMQKKAVDLLDDDWQKVFNTNLFAAIRTDKGFLQEMIHRGSGVIIHITSIQGHKPLDATLPYATSKAAIRMYSKGLSNQLGPLGIRVVAVSPGFIETDGSKGLMQRVADDKKISLEEARKTTMDSIGGIPMGRPGTPQEVAELVAFVASDKGSYLHGLEIMVDGGSNPTI